MKLTFIGAAHEVTGSCHCLQVCGKTILVDYGMEQGVNVFENAELPVEPAFVDYVLLTHAHVDHSGMLPKLYARGFRGQIFMTDATADLCSLYIPWRMPTAPLSRSFPATIIRSSICVTA